MRTFTGLILFIFVVLPMLCGMFFLAAINSWAFDRSFYQEIIEDEAVYEGLLEEARLNVGGTGTVLDSLPDEAVGAGLREVVTPEYLRTTATQIVDDVFDVLDGRATSIDVQIDLQPIKAALLGEQGDDFAQAIVLNLPQCRTGQAARDNVAEFPTCREEGVSDETLLQQIESALPQLSASLPDTVSLPRPIELFEFNNSPIQFPGIRPMVNAALLLNSVFALLLWLTAGIVTGHDRRTRLMILGLMMLVPAAFVLITGLAMGGFFWENTIRTMILQSTGAYTPALTDSVIGALGQVRAGFLIAGGIPFVISVLLLTWGAVTPSEKRKRDEDGVYVSVPNPRV